MSTKKQNPKQNPKNKSTSSSNKNKPRVQIITTKKVEVKPTTVHRPRRFNPPPRSNVNTHRRGYSSKPNIRGTSKGSIVVSHKEFLYEQLGNRHFNMDNFIPINAGLLEVFPTLAPMTRSWERAKYHKVIIHYESLVGNSTTSQNIGEIMMGSVYEHAEVFDYNNKSKMLNLEGSISFPGNKSFSYNVLKQSKGILQGTEYILRNGDLPSDGSGVDYALYDPAYLIRATSNFPIPNDSTQPVVGNVFIEYVIELIQMKQPSSTEGDYRLFTAFNYDTASALTSTGNCFLSTAGFFPFNDTRNALIRLTINGTSKMGIYCAIADTYVCMLRWVLGYAGGTISMTEPSVLFDPNFEIGDNYELPGGYQLADWSYTSLTAGMPVVETASGLAAQRTTKNIDGSIRFLCYEHCINVRSPGLIILSTIIASSSAPVAESFFMFPINVGVSGWDATRRLPKSIEAKPKTNYTRSNLTQSNPAQSTIQSQKITVISDSKEEIKDDDLSTDTPAEFSSTHIDMSVEDYNDYMRWKRNESSSSRMQQ